MITSKRTALKRARSGQFGRFSEELWKDEDIHAAIVKSTGWFPHSTISCLVRYLPEDMYEYYMEDVFHPLIRKQPYLAEHIPVHKRDAYICEKSHFPEATLRMIDYKNESIINSIIPQDYFVSRNTTIDIKVPKHVSVAYSFPESLVRKEAKLCRAKIIAKYNLNGITIQ